MGEKNNESQLDSEKIQQEIQDLKSQYNELSSQVKQLENTNSALDTELKQMHGEFQQVNSNIQMILQKLNSVSKENGQMGVQMNADINMTASMKKVFSNPLRKVAVGTLSVMYAMADKTIEKTLSFKENLEDIVAEAQYINKKKKMTSVENS
ncbi:MAG: hypothetical protein Q8936_08870 [Bacillota bacterium]|nr:hypothetical protein [Bacillota bacterium]